MLRHGWGEDRHRDRVLSSLARRVSGCRLCPRLNKYLDAAKVRWPDHRCKPVPAWGDERPRLIIVGLAPGMHGANRSGRMFTFDSSGEWLYGMLHAVGLASRPVSERPGDGLRLRGVYITAAARCAPPGNKPLPAELEACRPYLDAELRHLTGAVVILALGRIAHEAVLRCLELRPRDFPFGHGAERRLPDGRLLLDSYHPSRQNTNTGRLTRVMWRRIFLRARTLMLATKQTV
ncbi:MAG: uracil-DNA glycosylase [Planctomycetes bacterium]|nr:uracil-DNA glycosylase [Planctomycetota bacterium]